MEAEVKFFPTMAIEKSRRSRKPNFTESEIILYLLHFRNQGGLVNLYSICLTARRRHSVKIIIDLIYLNLDVESRF